MAPIWEEVWPTSPCHIVLHKSLDMVVCDAKLTNDFWWRRPSVVEMSVFSQECDQREQCAQPVDTNGPPHHLSCAALDQGDQRDHSQRGSGTLDSLGAWDRPGPLAVCVQPAACRPHTLTPALAIDLYRLSVSEIRLISCVAEMLNTKGLHLNFTFTLITQLQN